MCSAFLSYRLRRAGTLVVGCGIIALSALLGACGSTGPAGAAGTAGAPGAAGATGATGPAGPGTTVAVANAKSLTATITAVTFPTAAPIQPVVQFKLVNENGEPVTGLTAASLGFAVAKLVPAGTQLTAVPPLTAAPAVQNSSQWQSYIYKSASPAKSLAAPYVVTGTVPLPQATTESGTAGTFKDNGDGTYQYTFAKDVSADPAVSYSATLTHRVGFEIRGVAPANSPTLTLQPSTGNTTGITSREIVDNSTCATCHNGLAAHGGARTDTKYCVMCHNPSTFDPSTGESLDMKVMFHKIHMGQNLPSVATSPYFIVGYQNSISDYSTLNFPTGDLRTCYTCHNESNANTPDTVGWRQNPGIEVCGSCHDTDNWTTGANHSPIMLGGLTNADCAGCHGNATTAAKASALVYTTVAGTGGTLGVQDVHVIPERDYQQRFNYQILSVTQTAPGQFPVVKFQIVDPTNKNKPWNVNADEPFTHCNGAVDNGLANLSIAFAYSSTDYTNVGSGVASEVAEPFTIAVTCPVAPAVAPVANGDGTFTATSLTAVPATATGSAGVMIQGHPAHEFGNTAYFYNTTNGDAGFSEQEIPVPQPNAMTYATITDSKPVARRTVVDVANCDRCHDQLNGHGNNRVGNVEMCATCHNPDATDVVARTKKGITWAAPDPTDKRGEQTIDLKVMIHAIHGAPDIASYAAAAGFTYTPYVVYHGNARNWINSTAFPTLAGSAGDPTAAPSINDCTGCHDAGTFYPPDPSSSPALATTNDTSSPAEVAAGGPLAITAGAAVCSSCHITSDAKAHMTQNGANFAAVKNANGTLKSPSQESCSVCHAAGAIEDVAVVHKLSSFQ